MLREIILFGKTINMYNLCVLIEYLFVPIIMILIRKRFGYNFIKALFYGILTLVFGTIALYATSNMELHILNIVSNKEFARYEETSSFGYWVFMAPMFLLYCAIFCVDFRKITDYAVTGICFASSVGKLACVFEGCCEGPKDPNGIYMERVGYKVFPIQLYETLLYAGLFVLSIVLIYTFSKKHAGYVMPITGILFAIFKSWAEEYRTWPSEWTQNFLGTGHTYWQFFEMITLFGCLIWLIGTIICEKKGKQPKFETNALKRKFDQIKENRKTAKNENN